MVLGNVDTALSWKSEAVSPSVNPGSGFRDRYYGRDSLDLSKFCLPVPDTLSLLTVCPELPWYVQLLLTLVKVTPDSGPRERTNVAVLGRRVHSLASMAL